MNDLLCMNVLCVQNHNVILTMNEFFIKHPRSKISKKDFMKIQQAVWRLVKKEMGIKIE